MRSCRDFFWPVQAMNLIRTLFWLIFFHFVLIIKSSLNKKCVMPVSCKSSSVKICYLFWFSIYKNLDILLLWKLLFFSAYCFVLSYTFMLSILISVQSQLALVLSDLGTSASQIFLCYERPTHFMNPLDHPCKGNIPTSSELFKF